MSIKAENIEFTYFEERKSTLTGLTAEFSRDKITVLTGASGSGKSTLLYLLAGVYPQAAGMLKDGKITVEGKDPSEQRPQKRCALVGMMFQNPELQFCMDTVRNELIFCLENVGADVSVFEERMREALEFCEISHLENRTLLSLSGGERQKVMLACLVMLNPAWLLLDEPFANIDNASAQAIARKLKQLHEERGTGILAVDHRLDTWLAAADEIRVVENGCLREERFRPAELDEIFLEELGIIVPGRSYQAQLPPVQPGEVVLSLEHLTLSHGEKQVLRDVTAQFRSGVIYAIQGESGSGKSSLFGSLSGLYRYGGHALVHGKECRKLKKKELGVMGFVTQNPQDQFVGGTVRQEVAASLRKRPDRDAVSEKILREIRLWRYRDVSPYLLSQGQQRRLGVAALMANDCRVLICDEPTYAQDRNNTRAIMDHLCRQAREHGVVFIFSTHDPQLACDYADVRLELKEGVLREIH